MFNLNLFKKKQVAKTYHDAEIDLSRFDVFAIERDLKDPVTIIAYYDENKLMQEYWLACSPEKHSELVEEFRLDLQTAA